MSRPVQTPWSKWWPIPPDDEHAQLKGLALAAVSMMIWPLAFWPLLRKAFHADWGKPLT